MTIAVALTVTCFVWSPFRTYSKTNLAYFVFVFFKFSMILTGGLTLNPLMPGRDKKVTRT